MRGLSIAIMLRDVIVYNLELVHESPSAYTACNWALWNQDSNLVRHFQISDNYDVVMDKYTLSIEKGERRS